MCVKREFDFYLYIDFALIIIRSIYKAQKLVPRDYSRHIQTRTQALTHTSILTTQNLICAQLKPSNKRRLETEEDCSTGQKTWQSWERNIFRFDLKESGEGFCQRGKRRSFHVERPKTQKALEPTVESLVKGIWRLGLSEAEQSMGGCVS